MMCSTMETSCRLHPSAYHSTYLRNIPSACIADDLCVLLELSSHMHRLAFSKLSSIQPCVYEWYNIQVKRLQLGRAPLGSRTGKGTASARSRDLVERFAFLCSLFDELSEPSVISIHTKF